MNVRLIIFIFLVSGMLINCSDSESDTNPAGPTGDEKTVVELYGRIQTSGNKIVDEHGTPLALRGMSLFWSQWGGQYFNYECIKWLRDDWKCTVIRAALGVEDGGYLENQNSELAKVTDAIDACIDLGIYVIVDWHDHHGEDHLSRAKDFFDYIARTYGDNPNIIYELYNEPIHVSWSEVIKPYAEEVIAAIRKHDPDNLIIVGTPTWSQDVDEAANDPIDDPNVAYALHFYTGTHRQELRDKAVIAMNRGLPIFVSEWGLSEASGTGNIDIAETNLWADFLEQYNLSWCNWSIIDKNESSAALLGGASYTGNWEESDLGQSGKIIRDYLIRENSSIFDLLED